MCFLLPACLTARACVPRVYFAEALQVQWGDQDDYGKRRCWHTLSAPRRTLLTADAKLSPCCSVLAEVVRKVGRGKYSEVFEGIQVATNTKVRQPLRAAPQWPQQQHRSSLASAVAVAAGARAIAVRVGR